MASSSEVMVIDPPPEPDTSKSVGSDGGGEFHWPEEVEKIESIYTSEEALLDLCKKHTIPEEFKPVCAKDGRGPCKPPPEGTRNPVCVYEGMLLAGIRFPLHDFYTKILRHFNLAPSQLLPNGWRYLAGFVLLCQDAQVHPRVDVFRHFFKLRAHSLGWYHFQPYSCKRLLFKTGGRGTLPNNDGWKKRFFFLSRPDDEPWRCPVKWGRPSKAALEEPELTDVATEAISKLMEKAKTDRLMSLLCNSWNECTLPVLPPVKVEASTGAAEFSTPAPERKRKSPDAVTPPQQLAVAMASSASGASAGAAASAPPPATTRKFKSFAAVLTNPQQVALAVPMTPSAPDLAPVRPSSADGSQSSSATQLVLGVVQKIEEERDKVKDELRVERHKHAAEVAQLKQDLGAAKAEHTANVAQLTEKLRAEKDHRADEVARLKNELAAATAEHEKALEVAKAELAKVVGVAKAEQAKVLRLTKELQETKSEVGVVTTQRKVLWAAQAHNQDMVRRLTEELQAAEAKHAAKVGQLQAAGAEYAAKVGQLTGELEATKAEHAAKVNTIRAEGQLMVISAKHTSSSMLGEKYADGLRDMRDLVLILYPDVVDPSRLTPEALSSSLPRGYPPTQAPADQ